MYSPPATDPILLPAIAPFMVNSFIQGFMSFNSDTAEEEIADITAETVTSLGSTVDTFASRLKRKLKAQESEQDRSSKKRERRHALMMQAMLLIRKAVSESARIDLGGRFTLDLELSDAEGWPRVELNLIDELIPEKIEHALVVTASDRNHEGLISFTSRYKNEVLGYIKLCDPEEISKLPVLLKTILRKFLDGIIPFVLNPISEDQLAQEKPIALETDKTGQQLLNEDLFTDEDFTSGSNTVRDSDIIPLSAAEFKR